MNRKNSSWVDADELVATSHPDKVIESMGYPLPSKRSGNNYRMECPIENCQSEKKSSYGQLSIELDPPYRIHCFSCRVRGNVLDLLWILKHRRPPTGGKLRGSEFREAATELKSIGNDCEDSKTASQLDPNTDSVPHSKVDERPSRNIPLAESERESTRSLVKLWEQGIVDPADMSPAASRYFLNRPWLTPDLCRKWGVAYLPRNSKGTLRGRVIYRIDGLTGKALAYAGRDPDFDSNYETWLRKGRKTAEPIKARFPSEKFFLKRLELYGQQKQRLDEPGYRESLLSTGLLVVEGFNDVLALDSMSQPAVGAMSNMLTKEQITKVVDFARSVAGAKVTVMLDRDDEGIAGQTKVLAEIARHVPVLNGWSGYQGKAIQPEDLSREAWNRQREIIVSRWKSVTGMNAE